MRDCAREITLSIENDPVGTGAAAIVRIGPKVGEYGKLLIWPRDAEVEAFIVVVGVRVAVFLLTVLVQLVPCRYSLVDC